MLLLEHAMNYYKKSDADFALGTTDGKALMIARTLHLLLKCLKIGYFCKKNQ